MSLTLKWGDPPRFGPGKRHGWTFFGPHTTPSTSVSWRGAFGRLKVGHPRQAGRVRKPDSGPPTSHIPVRTRWATSIATPAG
jgi:hypothetical protein